MKIPSIFTIIPLFIILSCGNKNVKTSDQNNLNFSDKKIPSISGFLDGKNKDSRRIEFKSFLIAPIPLSSNDSSITFLDYGDSKIKQFYLNGEVVEFNPLSDGPTRIEGVNFKGIGYTKDPKTILIGTGSQIKKFDSSTNLYTGSPLDTFSECFSFSSIYSEIFYQDFKGDTLIISQNGDPCIDLNSLTEQSPLNNFADIKFLRIKSTSTGDVNFTAKIPKENDIISKNERFIKTRILLSYNESKNSFFAMINPTKQLYEFRLNDHRELEVENTYNLTLPYSEQPINYTYNNVEFYDLASQNLTYNFELKHIRSAGDYSIISYRPSTSPDYQNAAEAPFHNKYLLAIFNLKEKDMKIFSLDFNEVIYLGCSSNGDIWLYNVDKSEKTTTSQVQIINVKNLLSE